MVDVTQRLKYNPEGEIVFNFGKYAGKKVRDIIANDRAVLWLGLWTKIFLFKSRKLSKE